MKAVVVFFCLVSLVFANVLSTSEVSENEAAPAREGRQFIYAAAYGNNYPGAKQAIYQAPQGFQYAAQYPYAASQGQQQFIPQAYYMINPSAQFANTEVQNTPTLQQVYSPELNALAQENPAIFASSPSNRWFYATTVISSGGVSTTKVCKNTIFGQVCNSG